MNSLQFNIAIRQGGSNKKERHYLDFFVSGQSLKKFLAIENSDFITLFGWDESKNYTKHILNVFRLKEKSQLSTGRIMLYVCPECGDINCGAITATIQDYGDRIVWKDFGYETGYGGISKIYDNIEPIEFDRQGYFMTFSKF